MSSSTIVQAAEREVTITNPDKLIFESIGLTKLDLVHYYLTVAAGALRGVEGRPMVLKRFVKGIDKEAVWQKRAPSSRPDWIEVAELHYSVRAIGGGGRRTRCRRAGLGGQLGLYRP